MGTASAFELAWDRCPPGHAMVPFRGLAFDRPTGIVHSPLEYRYESVVLASTEPTEAWTREAFLAFVRGEFGSGNGTSAPPYPGLPDLAQRVTVSRDFAHSYTTLCERELVYGPYFQHLASNASGDVIDQMALILHDPLIGNKLNRRNAQVSWLREQLEPALAVCNRLRFVMPAFPFKDENPFRTEGPASTVDFGEVALLVRLHCLVLALYQVHAQGADWVLVSDGQAYADIFGADRTQARDYFAQLRGWRNELNLQGTLSIVELTELVDRCDAVVVNGAPGQFSRVRTALRQMLQHLASEDTECERTLSVLRRGMAWNLNTRHYLRRTAHEDLWQALRGFSGAIESSLHGVAAEVAARADYAALEYAAFACHAVSASVSGLSANDPKVDHPPQA